MLRPILLAALSVLLPTTVQAEDLPKGISSQSSYYERYIEDIQLDPQGRSTTTMEIARHAQTTAGVRDIAQESIAFDAGRESIEVLEAYTLKANGRRIPVSAAGIFTRASSVSLDAPIFSEMQLKILVFPELAAGDTTVYRYRTQEREPVYPGQYSMRDYFPRTDFFRYVSITLSAPKDMPLQVASNGMEKTVQGETKDAARHWKWEYRSPGIVGDESSLTSAPEYSPYVAISTFHDWKELADAYQARAADKAVATPAVHKLAIELTKGINDPTEKVKRIYEWVTRNVRYVGVYFGSGGVVPHAADAVLSNLYGDCKDHATLLQALLASIGVSSTQVLINSDATYRLPEIPIGSAFNHAIVYVPALDMYLDSTHDLAAFGELPLSDTGKPVVHTSNFQGVRYTPVASPIKDKRSLKLRLLLKADGSAEGWLTGEYSGYLAIDARSLFSDTTRVNGRDQVVRDWLADLGISGRGMIADQDVSQLQAPYKPSFSFQAENLLHLGETGATRLLASMDYQAIGSILHRELAIGPRRDDYRCLPGTFIEEVEVRFPPGKSILSLPKDRTLETGPYRYKSEYRQVGQTVTVRRELVNASTKAVCLPEQQHDWLPTLKQMQQDLNSSVIYQ